MRASDPPGGPLAEDYDDRIYECVVAGEIVQSQTGWDSQAGNNLFYDANIQMLVNAHSNGIHQAWPGRATRDTVPLSEVVTVLCVRASA